MILENDDDIDIILFYWLYMAVVMRMISLPILGFAQTFKSQFHPLKEGNLLVDIRYNIYRCYTYMVYTNLIIIIFLSNQ